MTPDFETIHLPKTQSSCGLCEDYARRESVKPLVVMSCEGACLRGELARQAANILCDELAPADTARLCLGGAFTKDTGQRDLARRAPRVVAIEGCPIDCASRMMSAVLPGLQPEIHRIPELTRFDQRLFSIREMPEAERRTHAREAAVAIANRLGLSPKPVDARPA